VIVVLGSKFPLGKEPTMNDLVDRYLAVWNETDARARRAAIDELFAARVRYVDPVAAVEGRAALDGLIGAVQQQFPGFVFAPGGPVDAHHEQARFTWHLGSPGAEPAVIGFDVAEVDADGRISQVLGFLDKVPG
jgi:hypothetical protein